MYLLECRPKKNPYLSLDGMWIEKNQKWSKLGKNNMKLRVLFLARVIKRTIILDGQMCAAQNKIMKLEKMSAGVP